MNSGAGDTTQLVPGYPIRTPWDHSLVDSSPRPIAASHVLHRLLVPRHPPSALSNLTTKMLASTMHISNNTHTHTPTHHQQPQTTRISPNNQGSPGQPGSDVVGRCGLPKTTTPDPARQRTQPARHHTTRCLFPQDPTGCRTPPAPGPALSPPTQQDGSYSHDNRATRWRTSQRLRH
jgi:hypothetical protein